MTRAALFFLSMCTLPAGLAPPELAGQGADAACTACHAELELLRQQVGDMAAARRMFVTHGEVAASAHADQGCADCHAGFAAWPHPGTARTDTCASCHEPQDDDWRGGVHAEVDTDGVPAATCADCHGVHTVADSLALLEEAARGTLVARCIACHDTAALPTWDVHRDTVSCAACHESHGTRIAASPEALVAPARQYGTCGACHTEAADAARVDAHGLALLRAPPRGLAHAALQGPDAPASCTACHGGHGTRALEDPVASAAILETCSACHADEADRYFGTYHGKATALGSRIVATCADCHGAHDVFSSDTAASLLHVTRVQETCATCHEGANASFVGYDSHPDPLDRDRNPPLFWSFVFMNGLLLSVLVVFGLHTVLWWVRILLDQRRAATGGPHV